MTRSSPSDVPAPPALPAAGEVHVWSLPAVDRPDWRALLGPADLEHVGTRRTATGRREVVTSRALPRLLAAHYLGLDPADVDVDRRCPRCGSHEHGRPRVRGTDRIDLSVAHSGGHVVVAVAAGGRVGVDVETGPRRRTAGDLPHLVCSPAERAAVAALPAAAADDLLHALWVRKEAVLKLTGTGVVGGLADVDVLDVATRDGTVLVPVGLWPEPLAVVGLDVRASAGPLAVAALATSWPAPDVRLLGPDDLPDDLSDHLPDDLADDLADGVPTDVVRAAATQGRSPGSAALPPR